MTLRRITIAFLILYGLLTLYSIVSFMAGIHPGQWLTPVSTLAGFMFALLHAGQREGWARSLRLLALVFAISLLFESVGVATGLVYGPYHYTNRLGPMFLGLVPYLIPVAWFMMSYPSFVIADRLIPADWKHWQRVLSVALVAGLAMTAWDVVMDPIMVASGIWVWDVSGPYHGIPLQNFWGWWLTIFTTIALYLLISGKFLQTGEFKIRPAGSDQLSCHRIGDCVYFVGNRCRRAGPDWFFCDVTLGTNRITENGKGLKKISR